MKIIQPYFKKGSLVTVKVVENLYKGSKKSEKEQPKTHNNRPNNITNIAAQKNYQQPNRLTEPKPNLTEKKTTTDNQTNNQKNYQNQTNNQTNNLLQRRNQQQKPIQMKEKKNRTRSWTRKK